MVIDETKNGILGIDAGGTFTDLAFLSGDPLRVTAKTKTPTLHDDLIQTIESGVDLILEQVDRTAIRAVNLATTLATNAIVENKLRPMGLILIGYDAGAVDEARRRGAFGTDLVRLIKGGHDARGNELAPLDEAALRAVLSEMCGQVDCLAISGYFSVRNTSHERQAKTIAQELLPGVHVTCGHELASDLDAIKRATTAALNAGLIPIVMELLQSVEQVCEARGIHAPITVVRGDGSLVSADWAAAHPIEMVLSGPAASACGACFLAGAAESGRSSWAVDVGGTTTDIISLNKDGKPAISPEGASVGKHRTLVKAIDIYTFGLGGDSRARFNRDRQLTLGPRRVRPLCVTALEYPSILQELQILLRSNQPKEPLFVFPGRRASAASSSFEKRILEKIRMGTYSAELLLEDERRINLCRVELEDMESRGLVSFSGFTPTDALHILGLLKKWDTRAAELGARLLALEPDQTPAVLAEMVRSLAVQMMCFQVFRKSLAVQGCNLPADGEGADLLRRALQNKADGSRLRLDLNAALIGVGAPTWAFIEQAGISMSEKAVLPEHADVAGAVGAAVGSFSLDYAVLINPLPTGGVRVHHPLGVQDHASLKEAVEETTASMLPWITERAKKAGAIAPKVTVSRQDDEAWVAGGTQKIYLRTHLFFTVSDEGGTL